MLPARVTPLIAAAVFSCACATALRADWINLTGAENAPNIAEIYIGDDSIRVVLEIYAGDVAAFEPLTKESFTALRFETAAGEPLPLVDIPVREHRLRIDRYSPYRDIAAAVPWATFTQPPADKRVLYAELVYRLDGQPDTFRILPATGANGIALANIGMVVYHKSVPVIDFRYLGGAETLHLDWDDPWYTRFENPNLSRHHQSALTSYLYVEPYEVRHELLIRPRDLAHWLDLGLAEPRTIAVSELEPMLSRIGDFLLQRNRITIDGTAVRPVLDRAEFIDIGLYGIQTVVPDKPLELNTAIVGVMLSYPTSGLPRRIELDWDLFNDKIQQVSATAIDPAGPFISYLTPQEPTLAWDNLLKHYTLPAVERVPVSGGGYRGAIAFLPLLAVALLAFVLMHNRMKRRPWIAAAALLGLVLAVAAIAGRGFLTHRLALRPLAPAEAATVIEALLKNVYHAFYLRSDEGVYDRLALTVAADLLEDVFLQQRRSFAVQSAGGAEAKVQNVELLETVYKQAASAADALVYEARWTASGTVSHWGHSHGRTNRYHALITISPAEDLWKIAGLRILDEERLMQSMDSLPLPGTGSQPR